MGGIVDAVADNSIGFCYMINSISKFFVRSVNAIDEDGDDLTYTWDFSILEKYKTTSTHQRIFTTRGRKTVKVIVSDGIDEAVQIINVNVS